MPPEETGKDINIERFKELSDGDTHSLLELLELYLSKTSEQIRDLEKAISNQASPEIARLAHSMIGANAMVGMESLLPALRKLEGYADKKAVPQAKQAFEEVCKEFKKIHIVLKKQTESLS